MEHHSDSTVIGPSLVPKLEVLRGDGVGTTFTLKFKTRLGRETDNDIVLADPRVSRYHCQITFEDGKWLLTDLGSANGTLLNGMPVSVPQPLAHGTQITLGDTVLAFVDPMDETDAPIDPSATIIGGKLPPRRPAAPASASTSKMMWITGGLVLILLLAVAGFALWLRQGRTPLSPPASISTRTTVRTTSQNNSLVLQFEDDFSNSESGWDDAFGKFYTKQYGNNQYHIEITTNNLVVWGLANRNAQDFELEVEATPETDDTGITYGIIFRYVDHNNYYRFDVSDDGFFLLTKFQNGAWQTLVDWTSSPAINKGPTTNVLKISAFGPDIAIFANGQELTRINDSSFSSGNFGFFTSTFKGTHSWVSFDNLKLWGPVDEELALIPTATPTQATPENQTQTDQLNQQPQPTNTAAVTSAEAATPALSPGEATPITEIDTLTVTAAITATQPSTATAGIALTPESPPTLPDFVTRDQPLARGQSKLPGKLIFPVYDAARGTYDLFRADTDGNNRELLVSEASQPAANKAGDTIAYRSWKADERGLISQVIGETDHWRFETFFEAASPAFSPNDDFFIFHSREGGEIPALYRTVGTEHEVLRRNSIPIQGEMPAVSQEGRLVYRGCLDGTCGLISSNVDGNAPQVLTDNADDTAPSISPDGQTVAFMSNRDGNWEIYSISIDGQNLQRFTNDPASEGLPVWSPNGSYLAFASNRDGEWAIWVMTASGKQAHPLFKLNGSIDGIVQIDTAHAFGWLEEHLVWTP